jgi:adenosine deaminase
MFATRSLADVRDLVRLPKAHLHVHLESTVRWSTLRDLDPAQPRPPPAGFVFDGFRSFADRNAAIRQSLRTAADFTRVAREFCEDQAADGVRYAEVTFTAASHGERLGDLAMPLEAVLDGLAAGAAAGIECRVILDHSRRQSVDRARRTLELARKHAADGVVGIGLAGDEDHAMAPFAEVLDGARDAGLRLVHHAGETRGPASIREALDMGHADRLGHGIHVLEDPGLVREVRDRGVALEVCPSSNVALGLVASVAEHPLPRLRGAGLAVTLSTDIPNLAGVTLSEEYARVRTAFGDDDAGLAALSLAGVEASFADAATKARLRVEIAGWLAGSQVAMSTKRE